MAPRQLSISSDDINALIYSYLEDSGFNHSSYSLRHEARLDASPNLNVRIPRGELVNLLTKALLYTEVEAHWQRDGVSDRCSAPFSLLKQHVCGDGHHSLPSPPELGRPRQELFPPPRSVSPPRQRNNAPEKRKASPRSDGRTEKRARTMESDRMGDDPPNGKSTTYQSLSQRSGIHEIAVRDNTEKLIQSPSLFTGPVTRKGYSDGILLLNGHISEVFVCSWHPTSPSILASGSKDATVRIWDVPTPPAPLRVPHVLKHTPETTDMGDITTLDWNGTGSRLVTGSYDGIVRVWSKDGEIQQRFASHQAPIFATKWSPCESWLLSASLDGSTAIWNMLTQKADKLEGSHRFHEGSVLDADWIDSKFFVSCSTDRMVHICEIGKTQPVRTFAGHEDEVNLIRFTSDKSLLASCSDDRTVRIWNITVWKEEGPDAPAVIPAGTVDKACQCVLRGHTREISSMAWCPNGETNTQQHVLATTSFDGTTRIWNTQDGTTLQEFRNHDDKVYTQTFSPQGKYLATGGGDGRVFVYHIPTGNLVLEWSCDTGGVFDLSWQSTGNQIAACLESKGVAVIDMARFDLADFIVPQPTTASIVEV